MGLIVQERPQNKVTAPMESTLVIAHSYFPSEKLWTLKAGSPRGWEAHAKDDLLVSIILETLLRFRPPSTPATTEPLPQRVLSDTGAPSSDPPLSLSSSHLSPANKVRLTCYGEATFQPFHRRSSPSSSLHSLGQGSSENSAIL